MNSSALRTAARSGGPPRQTRAASGGTPCVAKASLATTPMPVERMWPTQAERGQVPGEFRRDRGKGRRSLRGKKPIWVILHDRHPEAPRHLGNRNPSPLRDRVRGRVEQRRIEIKRLRRVLRARPRKGIGVDALVVHGQAEELQAE